MTTAKVREAASGVLDIVGGVEGTLRSIRTAPQYDEDYKIKKWHPYLTPELFERARQAAHVLSDIVYEMTER